MDTFLEEESKKATPKPGTWGAMNSIQRAGVIGLLPFTILFFAYDGRLGTIFGLLGWTSLLLGYVAGSLWRVRHTLHFWWSVFFACIVHACLLPAFVYLVNHIKGPGGKLFIYLAGGLVAVETLSLIFVLKRIAMWLHRRSHGGTPRMNTHSGGNASELQRIREGSKDIWK